MQFKLLYLASALTIAFASNTRDVVNGLIAVQSSATTLDNAINAFPNRGGSLAAALAIHSDVGTTKSTIDRTTSVAEAVNRPVSIADWNLIYGKVSDIKPIIKDALAVGAAKKPAFDALLFGGGSIMVSRDLQSLRASTVTLERALMALTPPEMSDKANAVKDEFEAAFDAAISVYA